MYCTVCRICIRQFAEYLLDNLTDHLRHRSPGETLGAFAGSKPGLMTPYAGDVFGSFQQAIDELATRDRLRLVVFGLAAVALILGFAVAQATGNRAMGGVLMAALALMSATLMFRSGARWGIVVAGAVFIAAFALSHPLGNLIGSWPAVILAAAIAGAASFELTKRT